MSDAPMVSIIIPVFNCEQYLARCLDSVFAQTFTDFEVIAVNDGSTDGSLVMLNEYAQRFPQLRVLDQQNAGQGAARNRALAVAAGEYVLFVDSDDFIEPVLLEVTVQRAEKDQSDLVHFDWKLYSPSEKRKSPYLYYNVDPFWHNYMLQGAECDELLRVQNQFSVTNLYRLSFLNTHGIRFEEGRIYEDNPFVVHSVNRAETVSLVHSPLYIVNPHSESTTRRDIGTEKHYRDHIYAIRRSFELLENRSPNAAVYLAAYHVKKFGPYYQNRIPRKYRRAYVRDFVDVLHEANASAPISSSINAPYRFVAKNNVFTKRRYFFFQTFTVSKNFVMPIVKRLKSKLKYLKRRLRSDPTTDPRVIKALDRDPVKGLVCFLGFDGRYTGNSKALFEQIRSDARFENSDLRFVTIDEQVPLSLRLKPDTVEALEIIASASVVVAETWVDSNIQGNVKGKWVQLWHGTPIKRILFDSHEPAITGARPSHKVKKYQDILRWDLLLADTNIAVSMFRTGFLFNADRILLNEYPRLELARKINHDITKKNLIRKQLHIKSDQMVILYAPTWRDYNYGKKFEAFDLSYRIDHNELTTELGKGWVVVTHEHHFMPDIKGVKAVSGSLHSVIDGSAWPIEELLAISQVVISDYSSFIFDAIKMSRKLFLFVNDLEKYKYHRGVYEDIWSNLESVSSNNVRDIIESTKLADFDQNLNSHEFLSGEIRSDCAIPNYIIKYI